MSTTTNNATDTAATEGTAENTTTQPNPKFKPDVIIRASPTVQLFENGKPVSSLNLRDLPGAGKTFKEVAEELGFDAAKKQGIADYVNATARERGLLEDKPAAKNSDDYFKHADGGWPGEKPAGATAATPSEPSSEPASEPSEAGPDQESGSKPVFETRIDASGVHSRELTPDEIAAARQEGRAISGYGVDGQRFDKAADKSAKTVSAGAPEAGDDLSPALARLKKFKGEKARVTAVEAGGETWFIKALDWPSLQFALMSTLRHEGGDVDILTPDGMRAFTKMVLGHCVCKSETDLAPFFTAAEVDAYLADNSDTTLEVVDTLTNAAITANPYFFPNSFQKN